MFVSFLLSTACVVSIVSPANHNQQQHQQQQQQPHHLRNHNPQLYDTLIKVTKLATIVVGVSATRCAIVRYCNYAYGPQIHQDENPANLVYAMSSHSFQYPNSNYICSLIGTFIPALYPLSGLGVRPLVGFCEFVNCKTPVSKQIPQPLRAIMCFQCRQEMVDFADSQINGDETWEEIDDKFIRSDDFVFGLNAQWSFVTGIDFSNNPGITTLKSVDLPPRIHTLKFNGNKQFKNNAFSEMNIHLNDVEILELRDCSLTFTHVKQMKFPRALKKLDLRGNELNYKTKLKLKHKINGAGRDIQVLVDGESIDEIEDDVVHVVSVADNINTVYYQ